MPHATTDNMTEAINGDRSSSQFLDHLTSYPVVSDGIETFKSNSYGKKSLEIADSAYSRFGKPVEVSPQIPIWKENLVSVKQAVENGTLRNLGSSS